MKKGRKGIWDGGKREEREYGMVERGKNEYGSMEKGRKGIWDGGKGEMQGRRERYVEIN